MGHSELFSTRNEPMISVVSAGMDSRRYFNRAARLGQDASELGQAVRIADRGAAVQYCISNDLSGLPARPPRQASVGPGQALATGRPSH